MIVTSINPTKIKQNYKNIKANKNRKKQIQPQAQREREHAGYIKKGENRKRETETRDL